MGEEGDLKPISDEQKIIEEIQTGLAELERMGSNSDKSQNLVESYIVGNVTAFVTHCCLTEAGCGVSGYISCEFDYKFSAKKCYAAVQYKSGSWYVRNLLKRRLHEDNIYFSDHYGSIVLTDTNHILKSPTCLQGSGRSFVIVEYEMISENEIKELYRTHHRNRQITKALDKLMIKRRIQSRSIFFGKFCWCG